MKRFLMVASYVESLVHFRGHLLDSLIANGIEVHAASPDVEFGNIWRRQLEEKGVTVHEIGMQRTGMNPLVDLKTFAELYRLMRRIRPDIVMGYTIKPVIYGTLSAWISRVPRRFVLITGLGYAFTTDVSGRWFSKRKGLRWVARLLYRVALRGTHKVFFQNPDDQTLFRQLKLLSAKTSSHVVNGSGVDLVQYAVASQAKGPVRFLMIARLLGDKGGARVYKRRPAGAPYPSTSNVRLGRLDR